MNNAGIYGLQDLSATDDGGKDTGKPQRDVRVRLSRALLPAMVQKGWGRVVFIASESATSWRI